MLLNNSYYYVRITGRRQIFISKTLALKQTQIREIVYKNSLISRNFWLAGNSKKIKLIV